MSNVYISRIRISRNPQIAALAHLLNPGHAGQRMDAHHRLLWSLFSDNPDAPRDFLWREDGNGAFIVLSKRPPGASPLLEQLATSEFAPPLMAGDRLHFALRANATRTTPTGRTSDSGRRQTAHIDLVMDALHSIPHAERAGQRARMAQAVAQTWLARQGERHGFDLNKVSVQDYSVHALPGWTGQRRGQPQFGVLDLTGTITVTDPTALIAQIPLGFGRAKGFGCGLMLIRRG